MAVTPRKVKNRRDSDGVLTGRAGTVYDVALKYKTPTGYKHYTKKGFATKKEAEQHEGEMKAKFSNSSFSPEQSKQGKTKTDIYFPNWLEAYKHNLRDSTYASYKSIINIHILPRVGHVPIRDITPAIVDGIFKEMFDKGLSLSTVRNTCRVLSVALEGAKKYGYIDQNPVRNKITKFDKKSKTPTPYTVQQMQQLMGHICGTEWEFLVMLAGMYGLRMSEVLGLRWRNVDMDNDTFAVIEQLPFRLPSGTTSIIEMAPVKGKGDDNSGERVLPITEAAKPYFERQKELQMRQRELATSGGGVYYENDIVAAKANGAPQRRDQVSSNFGQMLRRSGLTYLRFHDLRHTAATNMHQLTGDFYSVANILGHTLKGVGIQLGISTNFDAVTARYVDVRIDRLRVVLDKYHNSLHQSQATMEMSVELEKDDSNDEIT